MIDEEDNMMLETDLINFCIFSTFYVDKNKILNSTKNLLILDSLWLYDVTCSTE